VTDADNHKPSEPDAENPSIEPDRDTDAGERSAPVPKTGESGGPKGPEPTRYGDWERNGRCTDF
jgi:hypothetical protein